MGTAAWAPLRRPSAGGRAEAPAGVLMEGGTGSVQTGVPGRGATLMTRTSQPGRRLSTPSRDVSWRRARSVRRPADAVGAVENGTGAVPRDCAAINQYGGEVTAPNPLRPVPPRGDRPAGDVPVSSSHSPLLVSRATAQDVGGPVASGKPAAGGCNPTGRFSVLTREQWRQVLMLPGGDPLPEAVVPPLRSPTPRPMGRRFPSTGSYIRVRGRGSRGRARLFQGRFIGRQSHQAFP